MPSGSTTAPNGPTPARSGSPKASTGRRPSCGPIGSPGPTAAGRGSAARTWSSTSCTSARSLPRARSRASSRGCATSASWASRPSRSCRSASSRARETGDTTACSPTRRRTATAARGASIGWSTPAMPRAWRSTSTSSTTTSAPRGTTWASSADTSTTVTRPRGAPRSTTTATAATRCATTCWTTSGCGWRSSTSTASAWTPCTPSSTWARGTSSGRSRRWPRNAAARRGWPAIVIGESDLNDPRLLYPHDRGGHGLDAQWADDFHHAAHAFLTGERAGLLRRLRRAGATGQGARDAVRLRVGLQPVPRPQARGAARGPLRRPLRGLPPEPRPGGQPRAGRPAQCAARFPGEAAALGRLAPALALPAAVVHGRGVRRGGPVPLLLLVRRPGAGRGGARGPEEGVRRLLLAGRGPRPPGRGDLRLGQAELVVARGDAPGGPPPALSRPADGAPRVAGPARLRAPIGAAALPGGRGSVRAGIE